MAGASRFQSSFEAVWTARCLAGLVNDENLVPAFASANIKILPYQIAAARFALRSANLKGCILCDEGSLGKTYEALLVVSQRWYEGKERILIVLLPNLKSQWQEKLTNEFTLPITDWSEYTQETKGLCLMTYDEVIKNEEKVGQIVWDLAVFDEVDFLFKPDNKSVSTIKKAVGNAFKLLLTPTPITLSIMDIYGLIHFIDETLEAVLQKRRTLPDIQRDFAQNLETNKDANSQVVSDAESVLFTTFTKDVAEKIQVSPQYIQEQAEFINRDLWEVVKFYFEKHHPQYIIDDNNQTLTLPDDCEQPHIFYYWSGTRNSPYIGKRQYGMAKDFKPSSGRITLTSILAKGIFSEIECATEGEMHLETDIPSCQISMYMVELRRKGKFLKCYDVLTGKTRDGKILTQEECVKILSQPIKSLENKDREPSYWLANSSFSDRLPLALEDELKNNYIKQQENCFNADIDIIKMRSSRQKSVLEQTIETLRQETSKIKESISSTKDCLEELKIQKRINEKEKQLRKKEEGLFFEQMRIETAAEDEIEKLCGTDGISVVVSPIFKVQFHNTSFVMQDIE